MKKTTAMLVLAILVLAILGGCKTTTVTPSASASVPVVSESPTVTSPMVSESPATAPFAYTNYLSEGIVQSADCSGKFDAQFDENGKLFSVTFHEQLARGTAEEHFEAASKRFTETFGAPAVQDDNGTGTQYLEWQDKSSGTALGLTYSDLGTTDPTLMISVFEKSRYVEAGTGDWK